MYRLGQAGSGDGPVAGSLIMRMTLKSFIKGRFVSGSGLTVSWEGISVHHDYNLMQHYYIIR